MTNSFYVGNVNINATPEVMKSNIESQGVGVVEIEEINLRHNRFKSFRICIRRKDIDAIKDADFWPEGIVVQKYFFPKTKSRQVDDDVAALPIING